MWKGPLPKLMIICGAVCVGVLAGGVSMCVIIQACSLASVFVCIRNNRSLKKGGYEQLCQQQELSYAHTKHKPILLSIFSDLYSLCHVKTVTGVSPKARTLYHCLPLYLSVFIYCCSSLGWSGNTVVNLVPRLCLCHTLPLCQPRSIFVAIVSLRLTHRLYK